MRVLVVGLMLCEGADGKRYMAPNAWLMRTHFGWPADTPPTTGPAEPPPDA